MNEINIRDFVSQYIDSIHPSDTINITEWLINEIKEIQQNPLCQPSELLNYLKPVIQKHEDFIKSIFSAGINMEVLKLEEEQLLALQSALKSIPASQETKSQSPLFKPLDKVMSETLDKQLETIQAAIGQLQTKKPEAPNRDSNF